MTMHLIDDGTMDTCFKCSDCGAVERYSQDWRLGFCAEPLADDPAFNVSAAETAAADDHECPEPQPEEGDYILSPAGPLGGRTALSVYGGEHLGTFVADQVLAGSVVHGCADDVALHVARQRMDRERYWPNIWRQDDHGGWTLLSV